MDLLIFDPVALISLVGPLGVFAIVFIESGMLFGLLLPGDSLLFTAGLLASQGYFDIGFLIFGCVVAAILGDTAGYALGYRLGPKVFARDDSFFFNKRYVAKAEEFYLRHGRKTIVLARFIPIVRTLAPIIAGVGRMRYPTFLRYNVLGGIVWGTSLPLLGYFLGTAIPNIDRYLLPIVLGIIVLSVLPIVFRAVMERRRR